MNIAPPPIIEFATPLLLCIYVLALYIFSCLFCVNHVHSDEYHSRVHFVGEILPFRIKDRPIMTVWVDYVFEVYHQTK
jgi:hypothetical protein